MLVIMFLKAASRRWSVPAAQHSNSGTGTPHVQTRVKMGLVESQGSITARCHGRIKRMEEHNCQCSDHSSRREMGQANAPIAHTLLLSKPNITESGSHYRARSDEKDERTHWSIYTLVLSKPNITAEPTIITESGSHYRAVPWMMNFTVNRSLWKQRPNWSSNIFHTLNRRSHKTENLSYSSSAHSWSRKTESQSVQPAESDVRSRRGFQMRGPGGSVLCVWVGDRSGPHSFQVAGSSPRVIEIQASSPGSQLIVHTHRSSYEFTHAITYSVGSGHNQ